MTDSFRNEVSDCHYEWIIESLPQMIRSKTYLFRNETLRFFLETHTCSDPALFQSIFVGETEKNKDNIVSKILISCLLNCCIKLKSHL